MSRQLIPVDVPNRTVPAVSSLRAWCLMLEHACDGVDGTCPCDCHPQPT